ncbi:ATP-binding protein [Eshraghiella crossota]|uniref:ATP-binding protein n=1 Tax=Eshraghiella crossota TaxID=45851 RepID=UPI004025DFC5
MYRKDSIIIEEWLKRSDKALLVTGARQIGKTWLIREEIAKSGYRKFEVNFIDQPDLVDYLNVKMSANEFLVKLKMIMPEDCKPQETVVFFDEIQKCPEIVTKIKFLVEEGSFKYVMSGSLLGVELKGITSVPVGYLTVLRMYPMDFEEFMIANNVSKTTLEMLKAKFETCQPVDEFIHQKLLSLFFIYLIVGGMPDAVKIYIATKDIREVDKVQRDIVALYKEDFSQHESEDKKLKLISIYDIIPAELNKQNKKFVFTMLNKELKFDRYENSFLWLKDAGVALPVYNVEAPVIPLKASKSSNVFRLFSNDIGLLTSAYPAETKLELINKNSEVNNGAHFENAVAQQLMANGLEPYFCKKKNIGELDVLVEMDGKVVPIEVKSGKAYKAHKSLDNFMKISDYHIEKAYVLSVANMEQEGVVVYLPIYMCYLLKERKIGKLIVNLDMEGL